MKLNLILAVTLIACGVGCTNVPSENGTGDPNNAEAVLPDVAGFQLEGIWLKSSGGITDGMELEPGGKLHYLNMYSLTGANWFKQNDTLYLSGFTERYPQPDTSLYRMAFSGSDTLTLQALLPAHDDTQAIPEQYVRWKGSTAMLAVAGRWTGVEGTWLEVMPLTDTTCKLTFFDLDNRIVQCDGKLENGNIAFARAGKAELLQTGTGAQTGMKWLEEKSSCLIVANKTEGYCKAQ